MNYFRILLIIFIFNFIGLEIAIGQTSTYGIYSGNIPGKNAIHVKWFSKSADPDAKFDVYRKSGTESEWKKINTVAIERAKTIPQAELNKKGNLLLNDSAYVLYNSVMNQKEDDPTMKSFLFSGLVMQSLRNNNLALKLGLYFEDDQVQAGTSYTYKLTTAGNSKELAVSAPLTAGTFQKAKAPENFQLRSGDKVVDARWKFNPQFPLYEIYRSSTASGSAEKHFFCLPSASDVNNKDTSAYFFNDNDSLLQNGKSYFYKVCAIDYFGNESEPSLVLKANPKDMTPPVSVQGLLAKVDGRNVKLSWLKNTETDFRYYSVYRSLKKDAGFEKISTAILAKNDTLFTDTKVSESTDYFYYVEAEDMSGNKSKSIVIPFTTSDQTPPAVPGNIVARADTGKIFLTWNRNMETDLAGYYVYYAVKDVPSDYNLLNKNPLTDNHFTDTLPKQLNNFFIYRIAAADKYYNVSELSGPVYVRMPDVVPPSPPVLKRVYVTENKVVIVWGKSSLIDTKGFELQRRSDPKSPYLTISTHLISAKDSSYTDERIENNKTYWYQLIAIDSAGNKSDPSISLSVPVNFTENLTAPSKVTAAYSDTPPQIKISWNATAQPAGFSGYIVFRKERDGGNYIPVSGTITGIEFIDTGFEKGKQYYYQVGLLDSSGNLIKGKEEILVTAEIYR